MCLFAFIYSNGELHFFFLFISRPNHYKNEGYIIIYFYQRDLRSRIIQRSICVYNTRFLRNFTISAVARTTLTVDDIYMQLRFLSIYPSRRMYFSLANATGHFLARRCGRQKKTTQLRERAEVKIREVYIYSAK